MDLLSSPLGLSLGLIILAIVSALGSFLYNLYFHPLSRYPGPKYAAASRAWWLLHLFRGTLTIAVKDLHKRYGPVVRIAPNDLSFTDPRAWKDIYGHRPGIAENPKDPGDYPFGRHGRRTIVFADEEEHKMLRRLLSHTFSEKTLREQEPVLIRYADLLVEQLGILGKDGKEPLDLTAWFNYATFDIIGHLTFDESFGCLEQGQYHPWMGGILNTVVLVAYMRGINRIPVMEHLLTKLMPRSVKRKHAEHRRFVEQKVLRRKERSVKYIDFMTHMIEAESKGLVSEEDVLSHAETMFIAGSETTASLLTGVIYFLLTNTRVMRTLVEEIRGAFASAADITCQRANGLKYMIACLDETMRMYPPSPNLHARVTPPEGATICGNYIPGNVSLGMNHLAVFQSHDNFCEPERFVPERWLEDPQIRPPRFRHDKKEALQAFSCGPRNCIGKSLAHHEVRLILAKLLWAFDLEATQDLSNWQDQKIFVVWQRSPLMVVLKPVKRS